MKKILSAVLCTTLLFSSCSSENPMTTQSTEPVSSELISSTETSSETSSAGSSVAPIESTPSAETSSEKSPPKVVKKSAGYTSYEITHYNAKTSVEFEQSATTYVDFISKVEKEIAKKVSAEKTPTKEIPLASGGMKFSVRFYKGDKLVDEYSVEEKGMAKKVDGKFVEWYNIDSEFYNFIKGRVIVPVSTEPIPLDAEGRPLYAVPPPVDYDDPTWGDNTYVEPDLSITAKVEFVVKDIWGYPIENFYCKIGFMPPNTSGLLPEKEYYGYTDSSGVCLLELTQDYYYGAITSVRFIWDKNFKLTGISPSEAVSKATSTEKEGFFHMRIEEAPEYKGMPALNETMTFTVTVEQIMG